MIRWSSYQASYEDTRWVLESVYDLWPDIYPDSDSSVDGSSDEGIKYQYNLDYQ